MTTKFIPIVRASNQYHNERHSIPELALSHLQWDVLSIWFSGSWMKPERVAVRSSLRWNAGKDLASSPTPVSNRDKSETKAGRRSIPSHFQCQVLSKVASILLSSRSRGKARRDERGEVMPRRSSLKAREEAAFVCANPLFSPISKKSWKLEVDKERNGTEAEWRRWGSALFEFEWTPGSQSIRTRSCTKTD